MSRPMLRHHLLHLSKVVRRGDPVKTKWTKRRIFATCYGSAAVAVAIVLIASFTDGYTSSTYCFINVKNGMMWTLVGPLIFLAAVNVICLLLTSVSTCSFASIEEDETSSQPELMENADRSVGAFGEFRESRLRVARYGFENFLLSALSLGQWASAIVFYLERTKTMAILFGIFSAADGVAALIFYVLLTDYLFGKKTKDPPGTLHHFAGNAWRMEAINQEVVAGGRHQRKNEGGQSQYVNEAFNDTDGDDADTRRRHRAATATPPPTFQPPPPPSSQLAKIIAGHQQRRNRQGSDGFDATRQRVMIEMTERRPPQSGQQRTRFDMAASTPGDVRGAVNQQERPLRTATVMRIPRVRQLRY